MALEEIKKIEKMLEKVEKQLKLTPIEDYQNDPSLVSDTLKALLNWAKLQKQNLSLGEYYQIAKNKLAKILEDDVYGKEEELLQLFDLTFEGMENSGSLSKGVIDKFDNAVEANARKITSITFNNAKIQSHINDYMLHSMSAMKKKEEIQDNIMHKPKEEIEMFLKNPKISVAEKITYTAILQILDDISNGDEKQRDIAIKQYLSIINTGKAVTIKDCNFGAQAIQNLLKN